MAETRNIIVSISSVALTAIELLIIYTLIITPLFGLPTIDIFKYLSYIIAGFLALIFIGYLIFLAVLRKDRKELMKRFRGVRNAHIANIFAHLIKSLTTKIPGFKKLFPRLRNIVGREPEIISRNRLLFMRLLDQNLRFDIFFIKYLYIKDFHELLKAQSSEVEKIPGAINFENLKKQVVLLRSQKSRFAISREEGDEEIPPLGENPGEDILPGFVGWNYTNKIVIDFMNRLIEKMYTRSYEIGKLEKLSKKEHDNAELSFRRWAENTTRSDVTNILALINASKPQYDQRVPLFSNHHVINAYTLWLWDMFNVSWNAGHTYRFAKKGSKYIDYDGTEKEIEDEHTQITIYGEFAEDNRKFKEDKNFKKNVNLGRIKIRRLKNLKKDTQPFPPGENMGEIAEMYVRDWLGLVRDLRIGVYHPASRNVSEYLEAWDNGIWRDDKISWVPRGGSDKSPAFDLRVLPYPRYSFAGRRKYSSFEGDVFSDNKEPHMSQFGIKQFILRLIERTSANVKETKAFLANYPADVGEEPATIKEMKEDNRYAVGRFEEKST